MARSLDRIGQETNRGLQLIPESKKPQGNPRLLRNRPGRSARLRMKVLHRRPGSSDRLLERTNVHAASTVAEEEIEREHFSLPSCAIMRDSVVNWKFTMNQYGRPR